jgi:Major capsid protein 13-like
MAVTRLSDAIVPSVFVPYMLKETTAKTAIFQSGILRQDAQLSNFLSGGGQTVNVPFWNDLSDSTTANISSDDPAALATPDKIVAATDIAVRQNRNKAWSDADLVSELSGDDPMKRISARVSAWWGREFQRHLVSTLRGVIASNIANNGGDMVVIIGTDATGAPAASEKVSANAILDAAQTMGDNSDVLDTIIMHSVVYTNLAKQNLIDFIPDSEGKVRFPSYLGYQVVKDDNCPAVAGTNRLMYWTFLVGKNALGWAEVPPDVPVETFRYPNQGNGAGVEELWTRRQYMMHPYGVKWNSAAMAGRSPTDTELRNATNWTRVYAERKQVPIAVLETNG